MKFKDAKLQKKHGATLAKLFSKYQTKLDILEADKNNLPDLDISMIEKELDEVLYNGEGIYWQLKRDKHTDVIAIKPFTRRSVIINLHNRNTKDKFRGLFETNPNLNIR